MLTGEWDQVGPRYRRNPDGMSFPPAWAADPEAKRRALMRATEWTVIEAAFFVRCSDDHIYNLITDGSIIARDIRRKGSAHPRYRISRDSVLAWQQAAGAGDTSRGNCS